jgi:hypothetical protein
MDHEITILNSHPIMPWFLIFSLTATVTLLIGNIANIIRMRKYYAANPVPEDLLFIEPMFKGKFLLWPKALKITALASLLVGALVLLWPMENPALLSLCADNTDKGLGILKHGLHHLLLAEIFIIITATLQMIIYYIFSFILYSIYLPGFNTPDENTLQEKI